MIVTLRSDHGKFVSAEDGGGFGGTSIDERPSGLMTATRDDAGAWESIDVQATDEAGVCALVSVDHGGRFACCENAEADAEAGCAGIVVFNRDSAGAWEKFRLHDLDGDGQRVAFESVARPGWFIKAYGDGRVALDQPYANDAPTTVPGGYETFTADPPLRAQHVAPRITGQLRCTSDGYADDVGPVLPIGIHLGDLFSVYTRDVARATDAVRACSDAGYALVQFWLNLGSLGGDYWSGREIGPEITPDYWNQLDRFGDLLDSFGMRGIYCTGDYALRGMSHDEFARTLGHRLRHRDTAALVIAGNEAWQTGADDITTLCAFIDAFKSACPDVPITTTAPPTEEKNDIANWCDGDYYAIHGYRDGEDHDRVRHIFSVMWEGEPPCPLGYQDEPTGPGDEVSVKARHCYEGRDVDAMHLCALAAQSLLCDQGFNFFCSDGVKLSTVESLTCWQGFREVARVVGLLPRDLQSWPRAFHFGDTQSQHRWFKPNTGNGTRFDHRVASDGRMVGVLYGDQGWHSIICTRACECEVIEFNGTVLMPRRHFSVGNELSIEMVRSNGGAPGRTGLLVRGRLV
jgi:hypothetical protein